MARLRIGAGVLFLLIFSSTALAQSLFDRCQNRKEEIRTMSDQVRQIDNEMANINEQLRDLERQQAELRRQQQRKQGEKAAMTRKIQAEENAYKRMCSALGQCEDHERKIDRLRQRMDPIAQVLRKIREDLRAQDAEAGRLSREVDKIENSYQQLGCADLAPGETAETTIDQCTNLFKRWNDLQADINSLQRSLDGLRDRYQREIKKTQAFRIELAKLNKAMRENCAHSARLADIEALEREDQDHGQINTELDDMRSRVGKFRRLKIVKPVIKPKQKDHPSIKPKKKEKPVIKPK